MPLTNLVSVHPAACPAWCCGINLQEYQTLHPQSNLPHVQLHIDLLT
jgi:hypothetical protein